MSGRGGGSGRQDRTQAPSKQVGMHPPDFYTPPTLYDGTTPNPAVTTRTAQARDQVVTGAQGYVPFAYGRVRLPGQILYFYTNGIDFWYVLGLCKGECDSLVTAWWNNVDVQALYSGAIQIFFHTGTASQTVDTNLSGVIFTWNEALPGVCYAVVRLINVPQNWPELPNLMFEIKARKVLDTRTSTTAYSENGVLQFYDWQRDPEGRNRKASRINTAATNAAADIADQILTGSVKRYASHVVTADGATCDDTEKMFLILLDGMLPYTQNQFYLILDRPGSALASYDDSAFLLDPPPEGYREEPADRINDVAITWTDVTNNWVSRTDRLSSTAVQQGLEDARTATYQLPWIHDLAIVQTKLAYLLNSHIYDFKLKVSHRSLTADRMVGDLITQSVAARGIGAQQWRLISREKVAATNTYNDLLLEYNAAKYADSVGSATAKIASTLPDIGALPPDVAFGSIIWTEELFQQQANHALSRGKLAFTIPSYPFFAAVEVWVTPPSGGGSKFWYDTTSSPSVTPTLWETGSYTLVLYVRNLWQKKSAGTTITVAVNGVTGSVPEITSPNSTIPAATSTDTNAQSFIWFSAPASYNFVREYRVYDTRGANPLQYDTIPKDAIPTSSKPFNVTAIVSRTILAWNTAGSNTLSIKVTVISMAGVESTGTTISASNSQAATGGQDPHVPQTGATLSLSNGLNSNIATATPRPGLLEVTGPTGDFSIGGFTAPQNGERLRVFNTTTQAMTVVNEDASSTAANRIINPFAANIVLAAGNSFVDLEYSAVKSRFIVKSTLDSIGAGGGGLEKITSLNPTAPAFRGTGNAAGMPRGVLLNQSNVFGTTDTTIVNITGKGVLRFLSVGQGTTAGAPVLTLIIDGVTIINAQTYTAFNNSASATVGLYEAIIGAIDGGYDANALTYVAAAIPAESGMTFRSSLVIKLHSSQISTTAYCCFMYALY